MGKLLSSSRRSMVYLNSFAILAGAFVGGGAFLGSGRQAFACGDTPYLGEICTFAFGYCPRGFAPADGSLVSVQQNSALFALLGTVYGGNGTQTFALPDLKGRAAVNVGTGAGLSEVVLGMKSGVQQITLTQQQMPQHTHGAAFTGTGGGNQTINVDAVPSTLAAQPHFVAKQATGVAAIAAGSYLGQSGTGTGSATIYVPQNSTAADVALSGVTVGLTGDPGRPAFNFTVQSGFTAGTVTVSPAGGSQPVVTQSPTLGLTQCIATVGVFPPRP
ncbi:tail fiber protein [Neorhizobium sp. JUb45]|uniref:phage tail protein n=1 Tax=unclassified Neorhizobium TaxID=2629175 RepID=UPI001044BD7A|nr:tail fiber protein [Neorhizobium sp. JUb45]TCR02107.1 microcystin-dependent protein [Neorhizobium sp. JUb45]